MENVTGEQGMLLLEGSNLATLIFLTCSFHFWHLFYTMILFDD